MEFPAFVMSSANILPPTLFFFWTSDSDESGDEAGFGYGTIQDAKERAQVSNLASLADRVFFNVRFGSEIRLVMEPSQLRFWNIDPSYYWVVELLATSWHHS